MIGRPIEVARPQFTKSNPSTAHHTGDIFWCPSVPTEFLCASLSADNYDRISQEYCTLGRLEALICIFGTRDPSDDHPCSFSCISHSSPRPSQHYSHSPTPIDRHHLRRTWPQPFPFSLLRNCLAPSTYLSGTFTFPLTICSPASIAAEMSPGSLVV